jgi:hypothetical protein
MPAGQWIMLNVPTLAILVIMLAIAAVFSVVGLLIVRRFVPPEKLRSDHDIAGPIHGSIGVIYAVLLAFTTIIVWEQYDTTSRNLTNEALYYSDVARTSLGIPEPLRSEFRAALDQYFDTVIEEEWHKLEYGGQSDKVLAAGKKVNSVFARFEPATEKEKIVFQQVLNKLNAAGEMRRDRIISAHEGVPPVIWMVLIVGALITISFAFFFGSENLLAQIIMTVMLAALIAVVLFTILVLDYPFIGDMKITTEALEHMLKSTT